MFFLRNKKKYFSIALKALSCIVYLSLSKVFTSRSTDSIRQMLVADDMITYNVHTRCGKKADQSLGL